MFVFSGNSNPAPLPFQSPSQSCCNCGAARQVTMIGVNLKITRYLLLGGAETTMQLNLPFCARFQATANRMRQGLFSRLLITLMLFFPMLMWIVFSGVKMSLLNKHPVLAPFLLSLAIVQGYFALRRPGAAQTSVYQPVYLHNAERTMDGEIVRLSLRFTNKVYASKFREANKASCDEGLLTIEAV